MTGRSQLSNSARYTTLALTAALHGFTHLYTTLLTPLYFQIEGDLGLRQVAKATLLGTVQGFAYCLTALPVGFAADRWSRKWILAIGLAANAAALIALAHAPTYPLVLACVAFAGIAGGLYHPAANALLTDLYPTRQGRALGLAGMGASLGFFFGPLTGGTLGQLLGWRVAVGTAGSVGLVVAGTFAFLASDAPGRPHHSRDIKITVSPPAVMGYFALVSLLLSVRDFAGVGTQTFTSLFLQRAHGFGEAKTGLFLGLMSLSSLIANPLFGGLSDSPRRLHWAASVLGLAAAGTALIPWFPRTLVFCGIMWHGIFILASYPIIEAALSESVPANLRSRMFGVVLAVSGVLSNMSHWVVGHAHDSLRTAATSPAAYRPVYFELALLLTLSMLAMPTLKWVRGKIGERTTV